MVVCKGGKYGVLHTYLITDVSENPFDFCNNKTEMGVFVYNTDQGYLCGCVNTTSNKDGYLTPYGNFSKNDLLGWTKLSKEYAKENAPGFLENVGNFINDCLGDYHCILDIASIVALAIPGVGLAISAGLDIVNSAAYGVEASLADNSADRNAAIFAGVLTAFGGFAGGGIKQTRRIVKYGSKNPKIYKYADEVAERIQKELPNIKKMPKNSNILGKDLITDELSKIYKETAEKYGLKEQDFLIANDLLQELGKIDVDVANKYLKAMNELESKVKKGNLTWMGKEKKFQKMLLENDGDVITTLDKYLKKVARKEAVMEASLFATMTVAMEQPAVQEWMANKIHYLKYYGRKDIKGRVEKEGYNWDVTKDIFGSNSKGTDNELLTQAWNKGWRPYPQGKKEPTDNDYLKALEWIKKHPKYQTQTFKDSVSELNQKSTENKEIKDMVDDDKPIYLPIPQGDSEKLPDGVESLIPKDAQQIELKYIDNDTGDDWYEDAFGEQK